MQELEKFREQIDALDVELIDLLARRFAIVRSVGHWKAENNVKVVQSQRAEEVKDRVSDMAAQKGINPDLIRHMYEKMIDEAHIIEHAIADQENRKS